MKITEITNPYIFLGVIGNLQLEPINPDLLCENITELVAKRYFMAPEKLRERTRLRHIVEPRQIIMYLLCKKKVPLVTIAKYFNMDHTSVLHSRQVVIDRCSYDDDYLLSLKKIEFFLYNKAVK